MTDTIKIPVQVDQGAVCMVPVSADGIVHIATSTGGRTVNQDGPYTIWLDNNCDGWRPCKRDTLAECFAEMHAIGHIGDYRITRDVAVEFREVDPIESPSAGWRDQWEARGR